MCPIDQAKKLFVQTFCFETAPNHFTNQTIVQLVDQILESFNNSEFTPGVLLNF